MSIKDFVSKGISVVNDMGEHRTTTSNSICFTNGWVASIVERPEDFSVAVCDWNGYFNWDLLKNIKGFDNGAVICKDVDEVCKVLAFIEILSPSGCEDYSRCKYCEGLGYVMIHGKTDYQEDCPVCGGEGTSIH